MKNKVENVSIRKHFLNRVELDPIPPLESPAVALLVVHCPQSQAEHRGGSEGD